MALIKIWANEDFPYGRAENVYCEYTEKYKIFLSKMSELVKNNQVVVCGYNDQYLDGTKELVGAIPRQILNGNCIVLFTRNCMDIMNEIFLDRHFASCTIGAQLQQAGLIVHANSDNQRRCTYRNSGSSDWGKTGWALDLVSIGLEKPMIIDYSI